MNIRAVLRFVACVVTAELAGALGALFTSSSVSTWYTTLEKPALNPPAWIFGPVWITLYFLMGVAAFLVWQAGMRRREVKLALTAFFVQLILNAIWSPLFFGWQSPLFALIDIVLLLAAIVWAMFLFYKVSRLAAYLLAPYLLWVCFATYLNTAILILNA